MKVDPLAEIAVPQIYAPLPVRNNVWPTICDLNPLLDELRDAAVVPDGKSQSQGPPAAVYKDRGTHLIKPA